MKDTTKEFAKDCGNVAIEGIKAVAVNSVINMGSTVTVAEVLTIAYNLGCKVLKCTPEGKALDAAIKVIGYGGIIGGAVLGGYLNGKFNTLEGFANALDDVTDKYSKKDSVVTVKFDWEPVMPE